MRGGQRFNALVVGGAMLFTGLSAGAQPSTSSARLQAGQAGPTFKARLSTVPISAAEMPRIQGSGSATATLEGTTLVISGTFQGLVSPATEAHVHHAPKAMRGPAVFPLTITKATSGTISGTVKLTPAQVDALKKGNMYIQIHSEKAPEGNLWGWLLR